MRKLPASETPSRMFTIPVSNQYSAPTTKSPSFRINCFSNSEPCRKWFTDARTLARIASLTKASASSSRRPGSKASTDGRTRSTMERRFRD